MLQVFVKIAKMVQFQTEMVESVLLLIVVLKDALNIPVNNKTVNVFQIGVKQTKSTKWMAHASLVRLD